MFCNKKKGEVGKIDRLEKWTDYIVYASDISKLPISRINVIFE